MKIYGEVDAELLLLLPSALSLSCQLHAPSALPPDKSPLYQLNWRLGSLIKSRLVVNIYHSVIK
jgi:hypothetical protein